MIVVAGPSWLTEEAGEHARRNRVGLRYGICPVFPNIYCFRK